MALPKPILEYDSVRAWAEGWWRMPVTVGDEVGRIIGAPAGSVVMHPNVSICQALILSVPANNADRIRPSDHRIEGDLVMRSLIIRRPHLSRVIIEP